MDSVKWIRALRNVVRMVHERSVANDNRLENCIYPDLLKKLGLNESCRVISPDNQPSIDSFDSNILVSDTTIILLDDPSIPRESKYTFSGPYHAIVLSSTGSGISGCTETFHVDRMQLCIVDHVMYCPHRRLVGEERQAVLDRFGSDLNKYPKIAHNDPVIRYFGWGLESLIEIHVEDVPDGMRKIKYRVVWNVKKEEE